MSLNECVHRPILDPWICSFSWKQLSSWAPAGCHRACPSVVLVLATCPASEHHVVGSAAVDVLQSWCLRCMSTSQIHQHWTCCTCGHRVWCAQLSAWTEWPALVCSVCGGCLTGWSLGIAASIFSWGFWWWSFHRCKRCICPLFPACLLPKQACLLVISFDPAVCWNPL